MSVGRRPMRQPVRRPALHGSEVPAEKLLFGQRELSRAFLQMSDSCGEVWIKGAGMAWKPSLRYTGRSVSSAGKSLSLEANRMGRSPVQNRENNAQVED